MMNENNAKPKIKVVMLLDLICEWCCLAHSILSTLSDDYELDMHYLFMEIHPDAPPYGMPMEWHVEKAEEFYNLLNAIGEPYGIHFFHRDVFSNTHLALRVAEYAKTQGKGEQFLKQVWQLYMFEGKNISDPAVIAEAARKSGLPPQGMDRALIDPQTEQSLLQNAKYNDDLGFDGNVPVFIINDKYTFSGVHSAETLREIINKSLHPNSEDAPSIKNQENE